MAGVPIGMKDLFATTGVATTAASHMLEGFTPRYESTVSGKLRTSSNLVGLPQVCSPNGSITGVPQCP